MECPHCGSGFEATPHTFSLGIDQDGTWYIASSRCPVCDHLIVSVCSKEGAKYPALPAGKVRAELSKDVPVDLAADYWAASQILPYSEEASAAVSRRLLQKVLSAKAGAADGGLAEQVQQAIDSPSMPDYLKEALATLAKLAGLDPQEVKSYRCDAVLPVNEGEAQWLLDVLKPLFEFCYVQPALVARLRKPIEARLTPAPIVDSGELEEAEAEVDDQADAPAADEEVPPAQPAPGRPPKEPVR
jgi:hypothetical protein